MLFYSNLYECYFIYECHPKAAERTAGGEPSPHPHSLPVQDATVAYARSVWGRVAAAEEEFARTFLVKVQ